MAKDIFISHAHADAKVAIALTDCLVAGAGLSFRDILCTSHPNQKTRLRRGEDINQTLKKHLEDTRVIIPLISIESVSRNYVLFEIGGAWALGVHIMPIIVEKRARRLMPEVLSGLFYTQFNQKAEIKDLVHDVAEKCFVARDQPDESEVDAAVSNYFDAIKNI